MAIGAYITGINSLDKKKKEREIVILDFYFATLSVHYPLSHISSRMYFCTLQFVEKDARPLDKEKQLYFYILPSTCTNHGSIYFSFA